MKTIRSLLVLAVLLVVATAFTACSKSKEEAKKAGPVTIEFFNQKGEAATILTKIAADFNAANPDIKIEVNSVPDSSDVLMSRIASGDVPEILTHWPNATFNEQVTAGAYMDLTGDAVLGNIRPEVISECKFNGKNYVIPISYNTVGIYYNKKIFADNGIAIPKTFDELLTVAKKLQAKKIAPFSLLNKNPGAILQYTMSFFYSMDNYDAFLADSLKGKLNTALYGNQLKEVAASISKINKYAQPNSLAADNEAALAEFANGKAAMTVMGSWSIPSIKSANPNLEFEMFTFPGTTEAKTVAGVFTGDFGVAVSAKAVHVEQIKKFLTYLTSTPVAQYYAENDGSISCVKGVNFTAPELKAQYVVIASGKVKMYPDAFWNGTVNKLVGQSIQELIISGNADAWIVSMNKIFSDEYAK